MDWLKDKKNLPIVVGLAAFVLLAAGGLIAFETGLFGGSAPAPTPVAPRVATPSPAMPPGAPGGSPGMPPGAPGMTASGFGGAPPASHGGPPASGPKMAAVPTDPALVNPAVGPDPFKIAGGQKTLAIRQNGNTGKLNGMKASLSRILPPFNLFKLQAPPPPAFVAPPTQVASALSGDYKLIGVVNAADGIFAILETGGQSQTVKPGDSLPDGGKVLSIQATSITLRAAGGGTFSVPLSTGTGQSDQTQNGQDPNAGNFTGQPGGGFPGQPFNPNGGG